MIITFPALQTINAGVQLAYNTQFGMDQAMADKFKKFCYLGASTGREEIYPRLDMLFGLREWIGDRQVRNVTASSFTIANKTFEETIGIGREDIEDDKFGLLTPIAQQLGQNAARFPSILVANLLKAGHTTLCYDGQNFFDTAHPSFDSAGAAATASNYQSGSSPIWFMFDTSRIQKPVIFQERRPFQIIPKFSMTDPQVFWNKEFEWGVDGRCNVGFGLWQTGYMSAAALTHDNVKTAIQTMAAYRRPDGSPIGIRPNLLVTGTNNSFVANALATNEFQPTDVTATSLVPNQVRGMFDVLTFEWLN